MTGHHAPNEAGELTGDGSSGDVVGTAVGDFPEFALEPFVGFVSVGNDSRFVSFLSCFQSFGFLSDLSPAVALSGFCEQQSQVRVPSFCNPCSSGSIAAGVFAGNKAQVRGEMFCCWETVEVADFNDGGQGGMLADAVEANELVYLFSVLLLAGQLQDPPVIVLQLLRHLVVLNQEFLKGFL